MTSRFSNPSSVRQWLAKQPLEYRAELARQIFAEQARRSLKEFIKFGWSWIEPREFRDNWHISLICEHLEAVTRGELKRVLFNLPPRTSKSRIVSIFWPIWSWLQDDITGEDGIKIPTCGPGARYVCFSYADALSRDLSLDSRALCEHEQFQKHYGKRVTLRIDQSAKRRFDNTKGGYRIASSVKGIATGLGGDVLDVDDPQKADVRQKELETVLRWFSEVLPSRLNDRKRGAIIVTMQRVHEKDVSGHILSRNLGYEHLCLPMRYEADHPHISMYDPRKRDGEVLWQGHAGEEEVRDLEISLGSYASASQLQQRPAPREGGMFKRHWFEIVPERPALVAARVRSWDFASTKQTMLASDPDWTVGLRMSIGMDGVFYIEDVVRFRETSAVVDQTLLAVAQSDRRSTKIRLPTDPGAAGKAQANYHSKLLVGYIFRHVAAGSGGSKEIWAQPLAAQAEAGNVKLVQGEWNEEFIDEVCNFPNAKHDDQIDAAAHAFDEIVNGGDTAEAKKKAKRTAMSFPGAW
jgi:predicted phage terminase large subunit-like protein